MQLIVVKKRKSEPRVCQAERVCEEDDQSHADLFSERRGSARGQSHAVYLRLRSVEEEEEACTTQEILDRHAGKTLQRTAERKRRKRRQLERKEDGREERRTGTG